MEKKKSEKRINRAELTQGMGVIRFFFAEGCFEVQWKCCEASRIRFEVL